MPHFKTITVNGEERLQPHNGQTTIPVFNGKENYRQAVSAPLRINARKVANPFNDPSQKKGRAWLSETSRLVTMHKSLSKRRGWIRKRNSQPLLYPDSSANEEFISGENYKAKLQDVHVTYDHSILTTQEKALDVLRVKAGYEAENGSVLEAEANLVTFIVPSQIGYRSNANGDAEIIRNTANQATPIPIKVLNFTYPKFNKRNDGVAVGNESNFWFKTNNRLKSLRDMAKSNIRKMLRLNLIAACDEYKRQGVEGGMPFILNIPGAFLRGLSPDLQDKVKKEIADQFKEIVEGDELKETIKTYISEFIVIGGKMAWGNNFDGFPSGGVPQCHVVNADIISIAEEFSKLGIRKRDGNPAEIIIPMMGESMGTIGNGALGDRGDSALDEDLFRRCLGLHALYGSLRYNGHNLTQNCHSITEVYHNLVIAQQPYSPDAEAEAPKGVAEENYEKFYLELEQEPCGYFIIDEKKVTVTANQLANYYAGEISYIDLLKQLNIDAKGLTNEQDQYVNKTFVEAIVSGYLDWEKNHHYVQIFFPNSEPSLAQGDIIHPVIDDPEMFQHHLTKLDPKKQQQIHYNIGHAAQKLIDNFEENIVLHVHNFKRATRLIKCLEIFNHPQKEQIVEEMYRTIIDAFMKDRKMTFAQAVEKIKEETKDSPTNPESNFFDTAGGIKFSEFAEAEGNRNNQRYIGNICVARGEEKAIDRLLKYVEKNSENTLSDQEKATLREGFIESWNESYKKDLAEACQRTNNNLYRKHELKSEEFRIPEKGGAVGIISDIRKVEYITIKGTDGRDIKGFKIPIIGFLEDSQAARAGLKCGDNGHSIFIGYTSENQERQNALDSKDPKNKDYQDGLKLAITTLRNNGIDDDSNTGILILDIKNNKITTLSEISAVAKEEEVRKISPAMYEKSGNSKKGDLQYQLSDFGYHKNLIKENEEKPLKIITDNTRPSGGVTSGNASSIVRDQRGDRSRSSYREGTDD